MERCPVKQRGNPYPHFQRCDYTEESRISEGLCGECKLLAANHASGATDSAFEDRNRMNSKAQISRKPLPTSTAHRRTVAAEQESELFFDKARQDEAATTVESVARQQEAELFFSIGSNKAAETRMLLSSSAQQEAELFFEHQQRRDFSAPAQKASTKSHPELLITGRRDESFRVISSAEISF